MRIHPAFALLAFAAVTLGVASCTEGATTSIPIQQIQATFPPSTPGPVTITPSAGSVSFTAAGATSGFTVTETGYTGTLTATGNCSGIATFTPASGSGPTAAFSVTAVAAGTCQITVKDASNNATVVVITVTTTSGVIS
jgi:hypothetical protein